MVTEGSWGQSDPPAQTPALFKGFPRAPAAVTQSGSIPTAPSHHPSPLLHPEALFYQCPPAPTCLQLARRPRLQLSLEVRVSSMGVPSPVRPGSNRHSGRSTGAVASPVQPRMVGREGHRGAQWGLIKGGRCRSPRGDGSANGAAGAADVGWHMERGGTGKSDPNTIVAQGNGRCGGEWDTGWV